MAVEEDVDEARNAVRPIIAFYLGGMGAKDKNFYVDLSLRTGSATRRTRSRTTSSAATGSAPRWGSAPR